MQQTTIKQLAIVFGLLLILVISFVACGNTGDLSNTPTTGSNNSSNQSGDYAVQGAPTVTVAFINKVLSNAGSPASGTGQDLYNLGVQYGIDPVFALAFFQHESSFGTTGEARVTLSLGNERCIKERPCIDQNRGGYAKMNSWQDGYDRWYSLISVGYVQGQVTTPIVGHVCTTIPQIIPVYAPSGDGNSEQAYISSVETAVASWRSQSASG